MGGAKKTIGSEPIVCTRSSRTISETSNKILSVSHTEHLIETDSRSPLSLYSVNTAIWELPEILLYRIGQFVCPPTEKASFFCHQIAPLCRASYQSILVEEEKSVGLWDLVLLGDYGIEKSRNESQRTSKRLKRSPAHKVRDAHRLMIDNTEIAYSALWELSYSSRKNALTKQKMLCILNEYGPVMVNRTMGTGGNFLVEVCRCRNTSPNNVLNCVQELVERRGALVNIPTKESVNSSLTALCVVSVRGMPKVVEYLLSNGALAATKIRCSGRFRLYKNPKKSLRCNDATPLEFSTQMFEAEQKEGATKQDLKDLNRCITLLKRK
mmetsp:Transcript_18126/g.39514  ORF Transcript_18126/g.39514 Transcript_18126/m.39514 type:complete len:325 (-) Transcript_18126:2-976(-)